MTVSYAGGGLSGGGGGGECRDSIANKNGRKELSCSEERVVGYDRRRSTHGKRSTQIDAGVRGSRNFRCHWKRLHNQTSKCQVRYKVLMPRTFLLLDALKVLEGLCGSRGPYLSFNVPT
jgi:hypothetical protein